METSREYQFICAKRAEYPQLSHASNIITKLCGVLTKREKDALALLIPRYADYLKRMLGISSFDKASIYKKVDTLNQYYDFMHENHLENSFSAQGKFRPTILEEFLFLLFKDYVKVIKDSEDECNVLGSGSVKAYSNIYFKAKSFQDFIKSPEIGVNEKDQDYAIYRSFDISINLTLSIFFIL